MALLLRLDGRLDLAIDQSRSTEASEWRHNVSWFSGDKLGLAWTDRKETAMFILMRTLIYATLFVGLLLVYLPARLLRWSGIVRPAILAWPQMSGILIASTGALIALSCVLAFVWIGRGTPAPFDPPRRLVVRGPYRLVRNPMYIGGLLVIGGAALYFGSVFLLIYLGAFLLIAHLFVVFYEEPTLRRSFGVDYEAYCHSVHRWLPGGRAH